MSTLRLLLPSPLFLACLCGTGLALLAISALLPPVPTVPAAAPLPQAAAPASARPAEGGVGATPLPPLSAAQRSALAERPLFSETRRPVVYTEPEPEPIFEAPVFEDVPMPEEPVMEPPPPEPPRLLLQGIIRSETGARALLFDDLQEREAWYGEGDSVAGWRIIEIATDQVRLSQAGAEFVVNLER